MRIEFYDTTLRDGAQAAGISYSLADKKQIFSLLSSIGIDLVEGGDPASNPKDAEFFSECVSPRLAAFGATCRKNTAADCDEGLNKLIATGAQTVCKMGQRTANIFVVFSQSAGKAFLQGAVFFQYIPHSQQEAAKFFLRGKAVFKAVKIFFQPRGRRGQHIGVRGRHAGKKQI